MKLQSLISSVVLGMAVLVQAQEQSKPAPLPYTPPPQKPDTVAKNPPTTLSDATRAEFALKPADPNATTGSSITLPAGTLEKVVAEIEKLSKGWPLPEGRGTIFPNFILDQDARTADMPGELRLRNVTPLQAVTMAVAAADCAIEPIYAPAEESVTEGASAPSATGKIIGYQITHARAQNHSASNMSTTRPGASNMNMPNTRPVSSLDLILSGVGLVLKKSDAGIVVSEILPDSPAAAQSTIERGQCVFSIAEPGKPPVDTTKMELEPVVALLRGSPGMPVTVTLASGKGAEMKKHTVTLVRTNLVLKPNGPVTNVDRREAGQNQVRAAALPKVTTMGGGGGSNDNGSRDPFSSHSRLISPPGADSALTVAPADNDQPIVRVYALGAAIVGRTGESVEEMKRKALLVNEIEELIRQTLDTAGLDHTSLNLSFHRGLGVLVAKASMAQHEMIEQVVKALRESEVQAAPTSIINPEPLRLPTGMPAK